MLEYPSYHGEATRTQKEPFRRLASSILIVLLLAGCGIWAAQARAFPNALNPEECLLLADMAIVARALADDKVERKQTDRIMARIYQVTAARGMELMRLITDAAYRAEQGPGEFAIKVLHQCQTGRGNLDPIFGSDL